MNRLTIFRRDLHQIPEIDLELKKTQNYILKALSELPCEISTPIKSSVIAYFNSDKQNTIAFRCDMDALKIQEKTNHSFTSKNEGTMHACGHDGHMAIMLEFAHQLADYYIELSCNILLIFQPGEESVGGAKLLCDTGFLKQYRIQSIFGIHLWPFLEKGNIATRKKEMMASAREVKIDVYGKSSHIAQYHQGIDALEIGLKIIEDFYIYVKKEIQEDEGLLRFGIFQSGTMCNIVSQYTHIEGSFRYFQKETYENLHQYVLGLIKEYEKQGIRINCSFNDGYPTVFNDVKLIEKIRTVLPTIVELEKPQMIAEDFSFYQKEIAGIFFFLGIGTHIPLHSDIFDFDEDVLINGVELYKTISRMNW